MFSQLSSREGTGLGRRCALAACAWTLLLAPPAFANAPPPAVVSEDLEKQAAEKLKQAKADKGKAKRGWTRKLGLGATGSATSSSNVVGAVDGATVQLGLLLDGEAKLVAGAQEWHNTLKVQHARTKTPVMDAWVKSSDNVELQSTWIYRLSAVPWVGPFARARLQTQIARGFDVRPTDVNVERTGIDGKAVTSLANAESDVDLTAPFEPILVSETIGAFATPLQRKKINLDAKVGAGGQHVFARGGYALTGFDAPTSTLRVKELEPTHQVGGEIELEAKGELNEIVKWNARTRLFLPIMTASEQKLTGTDALTTEIGAGLSVKLAKWASLDYVLNVRRIPLVIEQWQVQHGLMLTTGFSLL